MTTTWVHKFKCLQCSLHFAVYSFHETWPVYEDNKGGTNSPTCPECGNASHFMRWLEESDEFIFQHVPGSAIMVGYVLPQETLDV